MKLTVEDIKALAGLERDMDAGRQPYVMMGGSRLSVMPEVMEELGLETSQTINHSIFIAILQAQIGVCQAKIAMKEMGAGEPTK